MLTKTEFKKQLPPRVWRVLAVGRYYLLAMLNAPRCLGNRYFRLPSLLRQNPNLHLGCDVRRLEKFVNVDCRYTPAADIVHDCVNLALFPDEVFETVYSHAFFEHLFFEKRLACLRSVYRVLKKDGRIVFAGIPDFERIARAYLNKEKGLISETFDLAHVYRYTHGAPEEVSGWWMAQLHKSLFDQQTVRALLIQSGFEEFIIFRYCFRSEPLPVNLGFVGFKSPEKAVWDKEKLARFLKSFSDDYNEHSVEILAVKKTGEPKKAE